LALRILDAKSVCSGPAQRCWSGSACSVRISLSHNIGPAPSGLAARRGPIRPSQARSARLRPTWVRLRAVRSVSHPHLDLGCHSKIFDVVLAHPVDERLCITARVDLVLTHLQSTRIRRVVDHVSVCISIYRYISKFIVNFRFLSVCFGIFCCFGLYWNLSVAIGSLRKNQLFLFSQRGERFRV
jgi:hypothetical protein